MKYGRDIRNGIVNEVDDEYIRQLDEYLAAADSNLRPILADLRNSLFNGEDVTSDSNKNTVNRDALNITDKQAEKLQKGYKKSRANWHASFNTDTHRINEAIQYWNNFKYQKPTEVTPIEEKKKLIRGSNGQGFQYELDESGNKKYRSIMNQDEEDIYNAVWDYLMSSDENKSKYDVSNWSNIDSLSNWYAKTFKDKEAAEEYRKRLFKLIKSGEKLTGDDRDILDLMQIGYQTSNEEAKQVAEQTEQSDKDKAWESFNVGNIWDSSLRDKQIVYDPNTNTYRIDSQYMPSNLPKDTQGWYFNDDFLRMYSGYGYDWLDGKVNFNKQWYNESALYDPKSQLYQMLNNPNNDYYNKNRRGDYRGADAILKTDWDGVYYEPTMAEATAGRMGAMYQNPNLRYIETNYNRPDATYNDIEIDDTYNIWRYQDFGDNIGVDKLGRREERWTITDAYGNPVFLDGHVIKNGIPTYDFNKFSGLYDYSTNESDQKIFYVDRVSLDPNDKEYYDRYTDTPLTDLNGNKIIEGWVNPTNNTVHVAINKTWGGTTDTVFTNMPIDVYSAIKDKNFADNLNSPNNRVLLSEFKKLIQGKRSDITANNLISLGVSSEIAPYVINYFKEYWNSNPVPTNRPKMKNGGPLHLQAGGPIKHVGSERFISDKVNQLATQMQNPTASKVVFDGNGLTDTDKLELTALIADLGSFGAGLIPGWGDVANLVGGQAANWTRFAIDKQRKKEGLDAHPWRNYLASTGADFLSVVPILGDAVNLGDFGRKAIPFFKRTYDVITTGLAGLGLFGAKDAIDKLLSGENLTIEDVQALSTGLQSLTGLGMKAGMKIGDANLAAKIRPKQQIKHEFKFKDGETNVTKILDSDDIEALTNVKGRENINRELTNILKDKEVPEEQIPEIVKSFNYEESGLKLHQYGKFGKDKLTVIKPKKEHKFTYYLAHPKKKQEILTNAKKADIVSADYPNAAARWFWRTTQELPEGYELVGKSYPMRTKVINSKKESNVEDVIKHTNGGELDAAIITAERSPKMSFTPVQIDWGKINSGIEKINPYQKKKSNGFVQYSSYLNQEESAIDKAKTSLDELVNSDEFKKIRITNPELAKLMFDRAVENIAFNSNDDAFKSQLQTEANSYRRSFKTGGVLKAAGGMRTPEELKSWLDQMTSRIADSVTIDEPEITLPKFEFKKLSIPKINLPKLRTRSELLALPKIEKMSSSNIIPKRKFVSTETSGLNVPKRWSSVVESKPIKATIGASPTAPISEISSIGKTERKNLLSKLRLNNSLPSESEARTNFLKRHNITTPTKPVLEEYVEPISDFSDKDRRNELRAERRYLRHSSSDLEQFLEEHGIEESVKPTIPETSSDYMNDFEAFDENGKSLGIVPEESIANTIDPNSDLLAKHKYWTNMAKETVGNQPGESWWGRTLKALGGPEAINQSMSLGRLLYDIGTNDQLYDIQAKAAIDAANAQMQTNTPEYYSRKTINAGNALREKANREIQSLPPVNADYLKYAAIKQAITDQYNTDMAEATRLDSAQDSQNINTGIQEQRSYADMRSKIENANRAIQSGKMVALSQLAAAKTQANRQSIANYLLEKQTEFDKNRGIIDQANIADAKLNWTRAAQSGIEKDINAKFKAAYDAAGGSNTGYTIEQWVRSQPGYTKDLSEIMQKWQDWLALQESSYVRNQVPGSNLYMKSGGKIRSAKDQISINKHKAHDQNWVKSNESVRKAVSQLNKQAFEILMKLLS